MPRAQPQFISGAPAAPEPLPVLTSAVGRPSGGASAPSCTRLSMGGSGQGTRAARALCKRGGFISWGSHGLPPDQTPSPAGQRTPPPRATHPIPWALPATSPGGHGWGWLPSLGCVPRPPQQKGAAHRGTKPGRPQRAPPARPATWACRARCTQEVRSAPARPCPRPPPPSAQRGTPARPPRTPSPAWPPPPPHRPPPRLGAEHQESERNLCPVPASAGAAPRTPRQPGCPRQTALRGCEGTLGRRGEPRVGPRPERSRAPSLPRAGEGALQRLLQLPSRLGAASPPPLPPAPSPHGPTRDAPERLCLR